MPLLKLRRALEAYFIIIRNFYPARGSVKNENKACHIYEHRCLCEILMNI